MYIYHALINALSAHKIHINLNMIFYTHVQHSPTETIYIKYYLQHTHTHTHTHTTHTRTHTHTLMRTRTHNTHTHTHTQLVQIFHLCKSVEILLVLIFSVDVQHYLKKKKGGKWLASFYHLQFVTNAYVILEIYNSATMLSVFLYQNIHVP